jgi:hypothetical protein
MTEQTPTMGQGEALPKVNLNYIYAPETAAARGEPLFLNESLDEEQKAALRNAVDEASRRAAIAPVIARDEPTSEPAPGLKPYNWTILDDLEEWTSDLESLIRFWPDLAESCGWHILGDFEGESIARRSAWAINRQQEELIRRISAGLNQAHIEINKLRKTGSGMVA